MCSEPPFGVNLFYDFSTYLFFVKRQCFVAMNVNEIKAICVIAHVVI